MEARAWDGRWCAREREKERKREEEKGEGWPGGIATPDATLRFETGENEVGASRQCVGIFHPLWGSSAVPRRSLLPIVTYTGCLHCFNVIRDSSLCLPIRCAFGGMPAEGGRGKRSERKVDDAETRAEEEEGAGGWNAVINSTRFFTFSFLFFVLSLSPFSSSLPSTSSRKSGANRRVIVARDREFFIKLTRPVDSFGRQASDVIVPGQSSGRHAAEIKS